MKILRIKNIIFLLILYLNSAFAFLPIEQFKQENGSQIYLIKSDRLPLIDINIQFEAGESFEPKNKAGLSQSLALMSSKGIETNKTKNFRLNEEKLDKYWADIGAEFSINSSLDSFYYSLKTLAIPEILNKAINLASLQIANPRFNKNDWKNERKIWLENLAESLTKPNVVAIQNYKKAIFKNHVYGQITTKESLNNISLKDIKNFHKNFIQPCKAKISIIGNINKEQAIEIANKLLANLDNKCQNNTLIKSANKTIKENIKINFDSLQTQILIGQTFKPFVERNKDYFALLIGNYILGGGGLTSRLAEEVREKRGLTYGIYSSFNYRLYGGDFNISLSTRSEQTENTLEVIDNVLKDFVDNGPTEQELSDAKKYLINSFILRLDSNEKLLMQLSNIAFYNLPLDYLDKWINNIKNITREDIQKSFKDYVDNNNLITVTVGKLS